MIVKTGIYDTSIRISVVLGSDFTSKMIYWFGAGGFSHVDAVLPDGWYVGARSDNPGGYGKGVHQRPPDYLNELGTREQWIIEVPCRSSEAHRFYKFLDLQLDKKYDFTAIFAFAIDRDWREDNAWFCSELVCAAGEYAGIIVVNFKPNKITPGVCGALFQQAAYCRGGKVSCAQPYVPVLLAA